MKPRVKNTNLALYLSKELINFINYRYEQSLNPPKVEAPSYSFKPTITNYVPPKTPPGIKSENSEERPVQSDQKGKKHKIFTRLYNLSKEESIKKEKLTKEIMSEENKELKFKPTINPYIL